MGPQVIDIVAPSGNHCNNIFYSFCESPLMEWTLQTIFPMITTTVSLLFVISVSEQFYRKRKPHQLVWAIAMFLFAITAGAEGFSMILGHWIPWVYRGYYVLAALQVSFMGGGVLYLFDSRNIINERNTAKQFILFGGIWSMFTLMFSGSAIYFRILLIPSLIMVLSGIGYYVAKYFDRKNAAGQHVLYCNYCRTEFETEVMECSQCGRSNMLKDDVPASGYRSWWHQHITGRAFSHLFLGFSVVIFIMMTIPAWTAPLHESLLVTGKEVSGLPWQANPADPNEARAVVRLFSPLHTVTGGVALIGGGFYSYISWQLAIRRNSGHFAPKTGSYNLWIAIGALVLGQGAFLSGLGTQLGEIFTFLPAEISSMGTLYISEVISVSMMYWGFLGSDKLSKEKLLNAITFGRLVKQPVITQTGD